MAHRSGFAADVSGGAQGEHIILDSLDEGAFVAAVSGHEPKWVQFAPGLSGEIVITSNVVCDKENVIIDATAHDDNPSGYDCSKVFDASTFYPYEAQEAGKALKSMAVDLAGRSDTPKWCLQQ